MTNNNPFVFDRPVNDSDLMICREDALAWYRDNVNQALRTPLIIEGGNGIGKSTFLNQLCELSLDSGTIPIAINLSMLPVHSFTDFLWGFGTKITQGLSKNGLLAPALEKRMLILRPGQVFKQAYWQKLSQSFPGKRLAILLDNIDTLASGPASPGSNRTYREYLGELLNADSGIHFVATVTGRLATYEPIELMPFHEAPSFHLTTLSELQTYELINANHALAVSKSVSSYIHSLTWGHPHDIQRLCHALFERVQTFNLRVITVADVAATLRTKLDPGDFKKSIYQQRTKVSYIPGQSEPG